MTYSSIVEQIQINVEQNIVEHPNVSHPQIKNISSAYPQIRVVFFWRTPKSKILPKYASFEWNLTFCIPPVSSSRTPWGTRTPG